MDIPTPLFVICISLLFLGTVLALSFAFIMIAVDLFKGRRKK